MIRRDRSTGAVRALADSTETLISARTWCAQGGDRPESRAEAFVRLNEAAFRMFEIGADVVLRGSEPFIRLRPKTRIGAIPLRSPVTGTPSLGVVVQPRFGWTRFGEILNAVGLKSAPRPLDLPELPGSAGQIPRWVLSSIVLRRVQVLLSALTRRFEFKERDLPAPRGAIRWQEYASRRLPSARWNEVPCRAPELSRDVELLGAIHYTVRQQRAALESLSRSTSAVRLLLAESAALLQHVADVPALRPSPALLGAIARRSFDSGVAKALREGLQAIEWTSEDRGLAGLAELSGIPFHLDMEKFFESWAAVIATRLARHCGAVVGEQRPVALHWNPLGSGSARRLVPDVVVRTGGHVLVLDSKYKRHGEQILRGDWATMTEEQREAHRADLHQVLAYASLFDAPRVTALLLYPCTQQRFQHLRETGGALRRAHVASSRRGLEVVIAALPMSHDVQGAASVLEPLVRAA